MGRVLCQITQYKTFVYYEWNCQRFIGRFVRDMEAWLNRTLEV